MLKTEMRNEASMHIDKMDTLSMVKLINEENMNAVKAVEKASWQIAKACDVISDRLSKGGRLFYIGAGTSGRLGVMDAAECPPTFGVSQDTVVGIIAGGEKCMVRAAEAEEDDGDAGARDVKAHNFCEKDVLVGISASGGASYVVGALEYANSIGAFTISLSSNSDTPIGKVSKISIVADTGPEVITGSTRMKSGTAQKLILNMFSTCAMVKTGKVYENLMINLRPTNKKLTQRMIRIVTEILSVSEAKAEELLAKANWNIRVAITLHKGE